MEPIWATLVEAGVEEEVLRCRGRMVTHLTPIKALQQWRPEGGRSRSLSPTTRDSTADGERPRGETNRYAVGTGMQARCEKSTGSGDAATASFTSWKKVTLLRG